MALLRANFFSESLLLSVSADIVLPAESGEGPYPVLWLLHGEGGDHGSWQRNTAVERYATRSGVAVVMPAAETSFYADMEYGFRYFDYVARELPEICGGFFRLSSERSRNAIAGCGMGGYGALKIALSLPGKYGAAACLSGGNFPAGPAPGAAFLATLPIAVRDAPLHVFGIPGAKTVYDLPELMGTPHDLFALADRAVAAGGPLPDITMACGRADPFHPNAKKTFSRLSAYPGDPFGAAWSETDAGRSWDFLDAAIRDFITRRFPPKES